MTPLSAQDEHTVYELFKWSVLLKGAISLAEVVFGIAFLLFPAALIIALVQGIGLWLGALSNSSIITKVVEELAAFGSGAVVFVALYLLSRGLIKSVLIWALLRNILWAYPASLIVLGMFLVYQFYEIVTLGSLFVVAITIFDIVVMYFIWREWKIVLSHLKPEIS